ncbi:hypothetical protein BT63DRAFT_384266 [Microthyrium microscopicum]|uniref:Ribosome biogenesis protein Urb1 n=1 Tax=Microthyrium microscopicum TaxID=703497 RepID=A0A6A6ULD8_9PEZI|nr:hypothetical protein BT63DRAFT_384266 [Microthyrium microscopicum]
MSKRSHPRDGEAIQNTPNKRQKSDALEAPAPSIKTARDIHMLLAFHQDAPQLRLGIKHFKIFLETILYPQDEALVSVHLQLLQQYLDFQKPRDIGSEEASHVQDLIQTLEFASQKNEDGLFSAAVAILALLLKSISNQIDLRDHGLGICRSVLESNAPTLMFKVLSNPRHRDFMLLPCYRLLSEIVSFDGGAMARQVYSKRDQTFDSRVLSRHLESRSTDSETKKKINPKPTLRSNAVRYLLTNFRFQAEGVKMDIMTHTNISRALFRGLSDDTPATVAEILESLEKYILQDRQVSWSSKSQMMNDKALSDFVFLYRANVPDEPIPEIGKPVVELVHEFLLRVCTSKTAGVLRNANGWYPKTHAVSAKNLDQEAGDEEEEIPVESIDLYGPTMKHVPMKNQVLANLAQSLHPYKSEKEKELLLAIFQASPEVVADYWIKRTKFPYDPKLTATWIGYSAFIFSAIQLPVPQFLGLRSAYSSHAPPPQIVIENILPQPLNRASLTKGINSTTTLLRLFTIRVLSAALEKLRSVIDLYQKVADEVSSLGWEKAIPALVSLVIRRCPTMKDVILAFRRLSSSDPLQRESIARLLSQYYELLPQLALEEPFDVSIALTKALEQTESLDQTSPEARMQLVELEHLIKIAHRSASMSWWKRPESLKYSAYLTTLLVHVQSNRVASTEIEHMLKSIAQDDGILQSETQASSFGALVQSLRVASNASGFTGVAEFIDDCLQRYTSRPIIYADALDQCISECEVDDALSNPISVWIMTLQGQWAYVESNRKDHAKEIASWLGGLLRGLIDCGEDETIISAVADKVENVAEDKKVKKAFTKAFKQSSSKKSQTEDESPKNGIHVNGISKVDPAKETFDISVFAPTPEKSTPNFVKFKTGDVIALLESSSMSDLLYCLSSSDKPTRIQAMTAIQHLGIRIESSTHHESEMIYLLLGELVETSITHSPANTDPLPYVVTAFAAHALQVLLDPTSAVYPKVAAFLTLRPRWNHLNLVLHFLNAIVLAEPAEDTDAAPWTECTFLLNWLNAGLRGPADGAILRQVGAWEVMGGLAAHPSLGASTATAPGGPTEEQKAGGRQQNRIRSLVLELVGRAVCIGEGATLATRAGAFAWMDAWVSLGWLESEVAEALKEKMLSDGGERVSKWSFGLLETEIKKSGDAVDVLKTEELDESDGSSES